MKHQMLILHSSNLDTDAHIEHILPHIREYYINLIEPLTAEAYGATAFACLQKLICFHFKQLKS